MPHDVTMPQLGMAQDAGKLVTWLKAPGDAVAKGDALFEVETDKATMEVEAQAAGYLTGVTAGEGDDVPVGAVIARISDKRGADPSAAGAPAAAGAAPTDAPLPDGRAITMPQLGMAQDSGQLVAWHKVPGDAVTASDMLFDVETDKSTMEVEAGHDGYLAATLAHAGEDVAVGATVAIISADKPADPVARGAAPAAPAPAGQEPSAAPHPAPQPASAAAPAPAAAGNGRILASPKARRLALEQGLDLSRLAAAGHPPPYHVTDLDTLRTLPARAPAPMAGTPAHVVQRLTASVPAEGLDTFTEWAATSAGLSDGDAILAALAGGGTVAVVAIERRGARHGYALSDGPALSRAAPSAAAPELVVRDMRDSHLTSVALGAEDTPVLTVLRGAGGGFELTLESTAGQLDAAAALALLDTAAGRMAQPLRHLL